jgi:hypothetical protein
LEAKFSQKRKSIEIESSDEPNPKRKEKREGLRFPIYSKLLLLNSQIID